MNLIRLLHLINSCLSGCFGTMLCSILLYLILKKTTKEMKQYSFVLLQATIIDMILAFSTIFVDTIITVKRGKFYLLPGELFRHSSITIRYYVCIFWGFMMIVLSNFLCVLFLYRYLAFTRQDIWSKIEQQKIFRNIQFTWKVNLKILPPIYSAIIYIICFIFMMYPSEENLKFGNEDLADLLLEDGEKDVGIGFVFVLSELRCIFIFSFLVSMITVNYIIIVICTYKIWHHMKSVSSSVCEKTREVQKQLSYTLLYQTLSPIIAIFISFLILVVPTIAQLDVSILTIYSVSLMPWVPAINSVMTMLIIKPYRTAIKHIFVESSNTYATNARVIPSKT